MAVYNQVLTYTFRDTLASGNPQKIIFGAYLDGEFGAIHTASLDAVSLTLNNTISGNNSFTGTNTFSGTGITTTFQGKLIVGPPSSGTALQVFGVAGSYAANILSASSGTENGLIINAGAVNGDVAVLVQNRAGSLNFFGISGIGTISMGPANNSLVVSGFTGGVSINAPSSGTALTVTGVANANATLISSPNTASQSFGLVVQAGTNTSDYPLFLESATGASLFKVRGDGSVLAGFAGAGFTIANAGNVTIGAPSSGTALTITAAASSLAANISGPISITNTGLPNIALNSSGADFGLLSNTGANAWSLGYGTSTTSAGTSVLSWNGTGNVTISNPTSGTALTVTGTSGTSSLSVAANTGAASAVITGWNVGITSNTWNIFSQSTDPLTVGTAGVAALVLATNSASRMSINSSGAVVVNAPASGTALTVTAVAPSYAISTIAPNTASNSFGLLVTAGTNSSDYSINVNNAANTLTSFRVRGDGVVFGNDGTNLIELGYKDSPQNTQSGSYVLVASDRGKTVAFTATGLTATLNTGVFSAGAVISLLIGPGNTLTIAQGAGVTLQWVGNGSTTGNRTLTGAGLATVYWASGTQAYISGGGLT